MDQTVHNSRAKKATHLDVDNGYRLLLFAVMARYSVHRLGDKLQQQIQVDLLLVRLREEKVLQQDNVAVIQLAHNLQLPILEEKNKQK